MLRLAISLLFLLWPHISNGYGIDDSCVGPELTKLVAAMTDALNVIAMARDALPGPPGNQGNLFQSIFRQDTPALRQQIRGKYNFSNRNF